MNSKVTSITQRQQALKTVNSNALHALPSSPSPSTAPLPFVIESHKVVSMLIKSDRVDLQGFGGPTQKLPFWIASAKDFSRESANEAVKQKRSRMSRIKWFLLGFLAIAVSALVLIVWYSYPSDTAKSQWSVKSVNAAGVTVQIGAIASVGSAGSGSSAGTSSGALLYVPIGGMLPNGEVLASVDPSLQSYSSDMRITLEVPKTVKTQTVRTTNTVGAAGTTGTVSTEAPAQLGLLKRFGPAQPTQVLQR